VIPITDGEPSAQRRASWLAPLWRGHFFLFESRLQPTFDAPAGIRLLLIFVLLEGVIGPRFSLLPWLHVPVPPSWLHVPILLGLALLLVRFFGRLKLSQVGLYPWREWSRTEKFYFIQVMMIANVVFVALFAERLRVILGEPGLWGRAWIVLLMSFLWGFYQELVYRGILQTELVRRYGSWLGILASNLVYTFGPLHFYHFSERSPGPAFVMFAGIFAIGLFFAVLFRRSGNLCMVGIFHGLGDCYIGGLSTLTS
jgi:membrane protease YdiL (CAAX protease family)